MLKFLGLLSLLSMALPVYAQTCYVDMVDRYSRVVRSYTSHDGNLGCKEGMKQCRLDIRMNPGLGGVDCKVDQRGQTPVPPRPNPNPGPQPQPQPQPNPYPYPQPQPQPNPYPYPQPNPNPYPQPNPNPYPYPQPDRGYPYTVMIGEEVYNVSNNRFAEVISQDYQGKFVLRYRDNGAIGSGWSREDLAPLRGCDQNICVNDRMYNVNSNRYVTVIGLQMTGKFVLRYDDNGAVGDGWSRDDLAVLSGCSYDLCVGEQVWNVSNNRYAEVRGFHTNGNIVLYYMDNGSTGDGWSRNDVAVMKGCQSGVCVGQRVINLSNRRIAQVVALQVGNKFVLRFEDNGATGDGWDLRDISPIR